MTISSTSKGFTFLEVLLVIGILLVLAAMTAPNFRQLYKDLVFQNSAREIFAALKYAQGLAIAHSCRVRLTANNDLSVFWLEKEGALKDSRPNEERFSRIHERMERDHAIPKGILVQGQGLPVYFYEDGSASKAEICLCSSKACILISTKAQYGRIDISEWVAKDKPNAG